MFPYSQVIRPGTFPGEVNTEADWWKHTGFNWSSINNTKSQTYHMQTEAEYHLHSKSEGTCRLPANGSRRRSSIRWEIQRAAAMDSFFLLHLNPPVDLRCQTHNQQHPTFFFISICVSCEPVEQFGQNHVQTGPDSTGSEKETRSPSDQTSILQLTRHQTAVSSFHAGIQC